LFIKLINTKIVTSFENTFSRVEKGKEEKDKNSRTLNIFTPISHPFHWPLP
jgi:hypothetical protein